jgi:hypothetical protein
MAGPSWAVRTAIDIGIVPEAFDDTGLAERWRNWRNMAAPNGVFLSHSSPPPGRPRAAVEHRPHASCPGRVLIMEATRLQRTFNHTERVDGGESGAFRQLAQAPLHSVLCPAPPESKLQLDQRAEPSAIATSIRFPSFGNSSFDLCHDRTWQAKRMRGSRGWPRRPANRCPPWLAAISPAPPFCGPVQVSTRHKAWRFGLRPQGSLAKIRALSG